MSKKISCCICGRSIKDHKSNNPRPIKYEGRCCDKCDDTVVNKARIERVSKGLPRYDGDYKWSEERQASFIKTLMVTHKVRKPIKMYVKGGV